MGSKRLPYIIFCLTSMVYTIVAQPMDEAARLDPAAVRQLMQPPCKQPPDVTDHRCIGYPDPKASNILSCPSNPDAVNILCSPPKSENKDGGKCYPSGGDKGCYCKDGQFWCDNDEFPMITPGADTQPIDAFKYFATNQCNCGGAGRVDKKTE